MKFEFKTKDNFESLAPKLKEYFPIFIEKRIESVKKVKLETQKSNYSVLKLFSHRELGIAASYQLHQYEELLLALQKAYKLSDYSTVDILLEELSEHLSMIQKSISHW